MYLGKRAYDPVSGADVAFSPSFWWQLVQRCPLVAYAGSDSGVKRSRYNPRRMEAPSESFGMSFSSGGAHAASVNCTAFTACAGWLDCVLQPAAAITRAASPTRRNAVVIAKFLSEFLCTSIQ